MVMVKMVMVVKMVHYGKRKHQFKNHIFSEWRKL